MQAGRERLGVERSARDELPRKQMLAAVGQTHLMLAWEQVFGLFDVQVGQILLTRADLADRRRYLNARDALQAVLAHQIVPIINENDAVATEEIRVGDNDTLSALVANVLDADLLLILSDIDGLYTSDPRNNPDAQLIANVPVIDDAVRERATGSKTALGVGGMNTKIQAAELATRSGVTVVIANGMRPNVIVDAAAETPVGTRFHAQVSSVESRKRWILSERASGGVSIDAGAAQALRTGKSLLPVGVRAVSGEFDRGEVIAIRDAEGRELARGIARYNAADTRRIAGQKSELIQTVLGYAFSAMLVHADDLVLS
jgi:glutamate 5-kinase